MVKIALPFSFALLAAGTIAIPCGPIAAETISSTMAVSATVVEGCRVDAQPLDFGALTEMHGVHDSRSTVTLTCTPSASYVVTMDDGRNGGSQARRMAEATGSHFLAYDIFMDPARTQRWGGTPVSAVSAVTPADGRVRLPVYARLATGQTSPGDYSDTITVTVQF